MMRRSPLLQAVIVTLLTVAACNRSTPPEKSDIRFVEDARDPSKSYVEVTGASSKTLRVLRQSASDSDEWQKTFTVHVPGAGAQSMPIAGKYAVEGTKLRFRPFFPFEAGRQ
jgi:hypothetical protein